MSGRTARDTTKHATSTSGERGSGERGDRGESGGGGGEYVDPEDSVQAEEVYENGVGRREDVFAAADSGCTSCGRPRVVLKQQPRVVSERSNVFEHSTTSNRDPGTRMQVGKRRLYGNDSVDENDADRIAQRPRRSSTERASSSSSSSAPLPSNSLASTNESDADPRVRQHRKVASRTDALDLTGDVPLTSMQVTCELGHHYIPSGLADRTSGHVATMVGSVKNCPWCRRIVRSAKATCTSGRVVSYTIEMPLDGPPRLMFNVECSDNQHVWSGTRATISTTSRCPTCTNEARKPISQPLGSSSSTSSAALSSSSSSSASSSALSGSSSSSASSSTSPHIDKRSKLPVKKKQNNPNVDGISKGGGGDSDIKASKSPSGKRQTKKPDTPPPPIAASPQREQKTRVWSSVQNDSKKGATRPKRPRRKNVPGGSGGGGGGAGHTSFESLFSAHHRHGFAGIFNPGFSEAFNPFTFFPFAPFSASPAATIHASTPYVTPAFFRPAGSMPHSDTERQVFCTVLTQRIHTRTHNTHDLLLCTISFVINVMRTICMCICTRSPIIL
jgi:hypothetical protein